MRRPIAITIIAVLALIYGTLTLPVKLLVVFSPEIYDNLSALMPAPGEAAVLDVPLPLQVAHGLIGSLVWIAVGAAVWKGLNWGRWLAIFWAVTALMLTLAAAGFGLSLLLKIPAFAAMCFFLLNRRAAVYFGGEEQAA